ncbi:MAG: phosphatidylinositol mannoside acyltransferase [Frankiaceae bacterium]
MSPAGTELRAAWAGRAGRARRRLTGLGYRAGWAGVRAAPLPVAAAAFRLGADVAWWRRPASVRRLERNLARVAGPMTEDELRRLSRAAMRSYLRYWLEAFRLPVIPTERIVGEMAVQDEAILRAALAAGQGVIVALPHMGNWDHAGAWLVATGVPFTTVVERLEPEEVFDRFVAFRESLGMEVLPLTGGDQSPYRVLAERLRAGGCVCLVADRDLSASGVDVDFFGETARMPAGPAALAVGTGAALLPVTLWYAERGRGWRARIHRPVRPPAGLERRAQVAAMTQSLADAFAAAIAEHPADWHMLQRLWLADLDPRRPAAKAA